MKLSKGSKNRAVIYFFYDGEGVVDKYVSYMLEGLTTVARDIFVVTNGALTQEGRDTFKQYTEHVWERENKGLDVGAYMHALKKIGWDNLRQYDEIVLMNHTIMGPVFPLREMFDSMAERDLDFWGSNIYYRVGFDPYGLIDVGYIREHIQSHFIVARNSLISSADYREYWETLPPINSYKESVSYHETYFTSHFAELGYRWEAYAHWEGLEDYGEYPLFRMPVELFKRVRCPFFKRRNFIHENHGDYIYGTEGETTKKLMDYLDRETDYDVDMIWENILRTGNQADIKNCLSLNFIASETESPDMSEVVEKKGVALIYHFYYEDCLKDLLHYAAFMPKGADIYITTGSEEKKKLLEKAFANFPNKMEVILIENRGRDVSALLIGAKDIISKYEYICFAHDKKVVQLRPMTQGAGWSYKCFESVLGNEHVVNNVLRMFEENKRLGLLSPAPPNHAGYYSLLGAEWTGNFENVKKVAKELGYHIPMKEDKEPIAPIGTIFWFRRDAFRSLYEAGWTYEDFPAEPAGNDGTLAHAIERLYPYAVQNEGYYPAWLFSSRGAGMELTNLHRMMRELNRTLYPNGVGGAFFNELCARLEEVLENGGTGLVTDPLTPTLYLDYGEGYSEELTLRTRNLGDGEELDVDFDWPMEKGVPLKVRFDPCEQGGLTLKNVKIYLNFPGGKTREILLSECQCNGAVVNEEIRFEQPDPWIDISWKSFKKPEGITVKGIAVFE